MPFYDAARDSYNHPSSRRGINPEPRLRDPYPDIHSRNVRSEHAELFGISAERDSMLGQPGNPINFRAALTW